MTEVGNHRWVEIRVTQVTLLRDDDGDPVPICLPDQEPEVTYGCFTCNMGLEQGHNVPCPGGGADAAAA